MAGNHNESLVYCTGLNQCQGRQYSGKMPDCRKCLAKELSDNSNEDNGDVKE